MKPEKLGLWLSYPCGQCLQCRLRRQSSWMLRNQLESLTALSSSFWTLTLDDAGLEKLVELGPRQMMRIFFDSLRESEKRAGNPSMIRFFGNMEFGGQLGRPHFHMLLYNMVENFQKAPYFTKGFPRAPLHTALWPHGHVDLGTVTNASIRYVISYLTEFQDKEQSNLLFSTKRPAIGYFGLDRLAAIVAQTHSVVSRPSSLRVGGRLFGLDLWTRKCFEARLAAHGVRVQKENPIERKLQALCFDAAFMELKGYEKIARDTEEKEIRHNVQKAQKAAREISAWNAAIRRGEARQKNYAVA